MLPDRVSNPGPLTYESGALPIALRGLAQRRIALRSMSTLLCMLPPFWKWAQNSISWFLPMKMYPVINGVII